ncbi:YegP family protein [Halostella sp. JP-L12]|uniref:HVO_2922 family protein n=1 Tax=Halostella TaxID=1843185 RepID=UPI000EF7FD7E|nr:MULTISPECIES: HVO_2922 family protein [Halostella]NHN46810.1 YegP family protein [Halostella sp. JP-L12]
MAEDTVRVTATLEIDVDEDELELSGEGGDAATAELSAPGVEGLLRAVTDVVEAERGDAELDARDDAESDEAPPSRPGEPPTEIDEAVETADMAEHVEPAETGESVSEAEIAEALPDDPLGDEQPTFEDSKARFQLFRDRAGDWRWRLRHDNGNIIADSGEGYSSKQKAEQGLQSVKANAPGAAVELDPGKE